jgi:hypothetical protein
MSLRGPGQDRGGVPLGQALLEQDEGEHLRRVIRLHAWLDGLDDPAAEHHGQARDRLPAVELRGVIGDVHSVDDVALCHQGTVGRPKRRPRDGVAGGG